MPADPVWSALEPFFSVQLAARGHEKPWETIGNHELFVGMSENCTFFFPSNKWELKNGNVMMKQWNAVAYFEPTFLGLPPEMTLRIEGKLVGTAPYKAAALTGLTPTHGQCGPVRS